ncbi:DUF1840 domain-containing protein [Marinomonas fungiae]|uniref:DUF1840 domain-containing protein n=1 Tax=Marinomonas fungiae TaxID=1137284 RepID=A0A0K6IPE1_9GAMM|nr:DUF1840 domain-containing protein [Marinomonas fungiae]CUB05157.1 Domain of unknown function (DUF1840) [Marinomonas fungiae]
MLMTFHCHACADITMFGDIGLQMIKMMGYKDNTSGAIKAENIPQALERLTAAIAIEKETPQPQAPEESEDDEAPVSLANRAVPLIDMLNRAMQDECDIVWDSK